jgi:hypothetical protein
MVTEPIYYRKTLCQILLLRNQIHPIQTVAPVIFPRAQSIVEDIFYGKGAKKGSKAKIPVKSLYVANQRPTALFSYAIS